MDSVPAPSTRAAIDRLTPAQRALVGLCLQAIVDGPYIENDGEFHSVMGVSREQAAVISAAWPAVTSHDDAFMVISNALSNLLGYPHGMWPDLARHLDATKQDLVTVLANWRDEDGIDASCRHFDAML
jgi:hypothetical protein